MTLTLSIEINLEILVREIYLLLTELILPLRILTCNIITQCHSIIIIDNDSFSMFAETG